ncbi:protein DETOXIFICATION 55-like [Chenopodium quinoa]|uniref:Protein DETOXIFICATION n=1 Tax=Chenopodium quinoa TaxID=63459 RepID=A0A803MVF1_CHEQI|nr:protein DETOXIFICATION 55-like [Chenopodium quinoa]
MVESCISTNQSETTEVVEELKKMSDIGFPIVAMSLVGYLRNMILVVCMGRLGSLELAGGALAIGIINISGYSVLSGLAMGMEPICSHAFGSRNISVLNITLSRTIILLLSASLPIGILWYNLEPLMIMLHQDIDITRVASLYCRFAIPDLIAISFLHPLRIYLRSKGTTWPLLWCTLLPVMLNIPIAILLSFKLHLGVQGLAVATFITDFNVVFLLLGYISYTNKSKDPIRVPLLSQYLTDLKPSLGKEWGTLLKLSIPSCLGVCLEWWWYELMTLLAGYLEKPQVTLASSAIVIQTTSLMYTLPAALSASVSTRVGHELGAGHPKKACLTSKLAVGLALFSSLFGLLWTTLGRRVWGSVFTQDNEVLELTAAVLPIIGLCELANCPQTTACGVLRGSARPSIGAGINFYAFYMVGTPVAIVLGFVLKLGFVGLCYGLLAAQVACAVSILTVIYRTNWETESLKAMDLVGCTQASNIEACNPNEEAGYLWEVACLK